MTSLILVSLICLFILSVAVFIADSAVLSKSSIDFSIDVISLFNSSFFDILCVLLALILDSNSTTLSLASLILISISLILLLAAKTDLDDVSLEVLTAAKSDSMFHIAVLIAATSALPISVILFQMEFFNLVISLCNSSVSINFLLESFSF